VGGCLESGAPGLRISVMAKKTTKFPAKRRIQPITKQPIASPMPDAAPVTSQTLFSKVKFMSLLNLVV